MIGIDEVGRGCWAGPLLVVAARQVFDLPKGLADSKVLSKKRRLSLTSSIKESCDISEGWVSAKEIDALGLTAAMRLATDRALTALNSGKEELIVFDGSINYCHESFTNVLCVIDADATYPLVSAASIWAKVVRDDYMATIAVQYPDYGFESHVGYGTAKHFKALKDYGITPLHRLSFKPVKKIHYSR